MNNKRFITVRGRVTHAIHLVLGLVLFRSKSLDRKDRIYWATIPFFPDARFLAPQIAVNGIALRYLVVPKALRKAHAAAAIGELAQCGKHLPFKVGRRLFLWIIEENLVLDLQPPQVRLKHIHFFIDGHACSI